MLFRRASSVFALSLIWPLVFVGPAVADYKSHIAEIDYHKNIHGLFEQHLETAPEKLEVELTRLDSADAKLYLAMLLHWEKPKLRIPDGRIATLLVSVRDTRVEEGLKAERPHGPLFETVLGKPDPYDGSDGSLNRHLQTYVRAQYFSVPCVFFLKHPKIGNVTNPLKFDRARSGALRVSCDGYLRERLPIVHKLWEVGKPHTAHVPCGGTIHRDIAAGLRSVHEALFYAPKECAYCKASKITVPTDLKETHFYSWGHLSLWNYQQYLLVNRLYLDAIPELTDYLIETFGLSKEQADPIAKAGLLAPLRGIGLARRIPTPNPLREAVLGGAPLEEFSAQLVSAPVVEKEPVSPYPAYVPLAGRPEPLLLIALHRPEVVKHLVDAGHPPDTVNKYGKTALMTAAHLDLPESVQLLLDAGAKPNRQSFHPAEIERNVAVWRHPHRNSGICAPVSIRHGQRTALMYAAANASLKILELLLDAGADPSLQDSVGMTALDYLEGRVKGNENARLSEKERARARRLLAVDPHQLMPRDENGRGALHLSAIEGELEELQRLIVQGANVNDLDARGDTPLFLALEAKNVEAVKLLLEAGADPNFRKRSLPPPLAMAVDQGSAELVRLLIAAGAESDTEFAWQWEWDRGSILDSAIAKNDSEVLSALTSAIKAGETSEENLLKAALVFARSGDIEAAMRLTNLREWRVGDYELFFESVRKKDRAAARFFIGQGIDVNFVGPTWYRSTALEVATDPEILRDLLDAGADPNLRDVRGKTPLFLAVERAQVERARILLEAGADPNMVQITKTSGHGKETLTQGYDIFHRAVRTNNPELLELLFKHGADVRLPEAEGKSPLFGVKDLETFELLVRHGADLKAKFGNGIPLFNLYASGPTSEIFKYLLARTPDVEIKSDHANRTAMFFVTHADTLRLLLQEGAQINVVTQSKSSSQNDIAPIAEIAARGTVAAIRLLLRAGANPNLGDGKRALDEAIRKKLEDAVIALLLAGADPHFEVGYQRTPLVAAQRSKNEHIIELIEAAIAGEPLPIKPGFSCSADLNKIEQRICAVQALATADYLMSIAYFDLREISDDEAKARLIAEQRGWIKKRMKLCWPRDGGKTSGAAEVDDCILSMTRDRAQEMEGRISQNWLPERSLTSLQAD